MTKFEGEIRVAPPTPIRAGRLVIELFGQESPEAVENFVCLCTGEKGRSKTGSNKNLHFLGCKFHRIIKGFMCQGGDFTRGDGSGGESIWGKKFKDDRGGLKIVHNQVKRLARPTTTTATTPHNTTIPRNKNTTHNTTIPQHQYTNKNTTHTRHNTTTTHPIYQKYHHTTKHQDHITNAACIV